MTRFEGIKDVCDGLERTGVDVDVDRAQRRAVVPTARLVRARDGVGAKLRASAGRKRAIANGLMAVVLTFLTQRVVDAFIAIGGSSSTGAASAGADSRLVDAAAAVRGLRGDWVAIASRYQGGARQ